MRPTNTLDFEESESEDALSTLVSDSIKWTMLRASCSVDTRRQHLPSGVCGSATIGIISLVSSSHEAKVKIEEARINKNILSKKYVFKKNLKK